MGKSIVRNANIFNARPSREHNRHVFRPKAGHRSDVFFSCISEGFNQSFRARNASPHRVVAGKLSLAIPIPRSFPATMLVDAPFSYYVSAATYAVADFA